MPASTDRHRTFLRLETDDEFRERVAKETHMRPRHTGDSLDEAVWDRYQIQRGFMEASTDKTIPARYVSVARR